MAGGAMTDLGEVSARSVSSQVANSSNSLF